MDHFAGLDVSVKETSVCIVDDTGRIVREVKVASEPEALLSVLKNPAYHFKRIGLEAGPLSQWLFGALAEAGLPVICVETRHMRAVLKAQINKTDRNDARGMAQMMRAGLYRPVHVKTLRSQKLRMLLTHRKLLQSKAIAIENDLRGTLRNFGLKVGMVGTVRFEARIQELVEVRVDVVQGERGRAAADGLEDHLGTFASRQVADRLDRVGVGVGDGFVGSAGFAGAIQHVVGVGGFAGLRDGDHQHVVGEAHPRAVEREDRGRGKRDRDAGGDLDQVPRELGRVVGSATGGEHYEARRLLRQALAQPLKILEFSAKCVFECGRLLANLGQHLGHMNSE